MSFQTYIKNIEEKTGKTAQDFQDFAEQKGFTKNGELVVKATEVTNWLKDEFQLGHGHATAMYAYIKGKRD
ncbi:DUF4287 domain-containing protein [Arenibacter algicola]|uniref:DUF4287 domain-containing protein n=1 Tax=Arenibacter TaxID=178469 RepID=UPI001C076E14|nr:MULTISPECIES: DUF4287 domain-containing protein [Arenibacter]MBU2905844.1 DUF4287 domain-containing protein [Arenibacter algicola]MDO6602156.1 DUF4287 domain-containing protein [Arenibacter palladensis]